MGKKLLKLKIEIERSLGRPGFVFMLTMWAQPHPDWEIIVYLQFSHLSAPSFPFDNFPFSNISMLLRLCISCNVSELKRSFEFVFSFIIPQLHCWMLRASFQCADSISYRCIVQECASVYRFVLQSMLWVLTIPVKIPSLCIFSFDMKIITIRSSPRNRKLKS